jgi:hypothetical protein
MAVKLKPVTEIKPVGGVTGVTRVKMNGAAARLPRKVGERVQKIPPKALTSISTCNNQIIHKGFFPTQGS